MKYICGSCSKEFISKTDLTRHINRKTKCDDDTTICKYCQKNFSRKDVLKNHIKICKEKKRIELENLKNELIILNEKNNKTNNITGG